MKHVLASIAVVLLAFAFASGQDTAPKQVLVETKILGLTVKAGLDIGINFSNAMFSPDNFAQSNATKSGRTGLIIGVPVELGINDDAFIRFEPSFLQAGYRVETTNFSEKLNVNYLQVPVLFEYKFKIPNFAGRPYAVAGPALAFMLSAREIDTYANIAFAPPSQEYEVSEHYSGTNFGIQFGAGMDYPVCPRWTAFGDVRYEVGLTNVYNPVLSPGSPPNDLKVRYGGVSIRIGGMYSF